MEWLAKREEQTICTQERMTSKSISLLIVIKNTLKAIEDAASYMLYKQIWI